MGERLPSRSPSCNGYMHVLLSRDFTTSGALTYYLVDARAPARTPLAANPVHQPLLAKFIAWEH